MKHDVGSDDSPLDAGSPGEDPRWMTRFPIKLYPFECVAGWGENVSKLGHLECVWLYALPCGLSLNLSVWGWGA